MNDDANNPPVSPNAHRPNEERLQPPAAPAVGRHVPDMFAARNAGIVPRALNFNDADAEQEINYTPVRRVRRDRNPNPPAAPLRNQARPANQMLIRAGVARRIDFDEDGPARARMRQG